MAIFSSLALMLVGTAASVGVAAASAPDYANPQASSRKVVLAGLKAYPGQRQVDMAAKLGQKVEYDTGTNNWLRPREAYKQGLITKAEWEYYQRLNDKKGLGVFGNLMPGTEPLTTGPNAGQNQDQRTGTHRGHDVRVKGGHMQIKVGTKKATADFTGMGDAEVQGRIARESAANMLELQKKYGPEFIAEAKRQQELADPEGVAARRLLASEIGRMEEARKTRERPVAGLVDSQLLADGVGAAPGSGAEADISRVLAEREGTTLGTEDILNELETGPTGEARKNDRLRKMTAWLSSGASPTDADYREKQNSLANMASFLGGRTPQSQFASLSGAQTGAAPQPQGAPLVGQNANMMQLGDQAGANTYAAGVRQTANTVSPWYAGLSLITQGLSTAGKAGWQPATG